MKTLLGLIFILASHAAFTQQLTLVKDSLMNSYMKTGFANQHFRPTGKVDENNQRQGRWKDYEVIFDFFCVMDNDEPKQIFGNFLLYGEGRFMDGKREGGWEFFVLADQSFKRMLQKKVSYSKGEKRGNFLYYFPNGRIGMEGKFVSDEYEGEVKGYYESGQLYSTRFYKKGMRIGRHSYFFPDGKLKFELNFMNDTLDGLYQSYYPNGKLQERFQYSRGLIDGVYKYYYDNGQLWIEKEYKNGLLINVAGNFDREGNQRNKGSLKDGNGTVNYYTEEGKIYSVETFRNGKKVE